MTEPCPVLRLRQQDSVAVGPQERTYICGDLDRGLATETVAVNGELKRMCPRCVGEFVKEFHARTFGHRPVIADWFTRCAAQIEAMAADVIEGKL